MIEVARAAHQAGLCVVPPREDGTKAPEGSWKKYIENRPGDDQIERWYSNGRQGLGVVCGKVSGGLECFEFEATAVASSLHREYRRLCEAAGYGDVLSRVLNGYTEETPSGGMHVLWRCEEIEGNQKLARRPSTSEERATDPNPVRVLVETRGEGGYAVTAPSNGLVHPSGKPWKLLQGGFDQIATITKEERTELLRIARTLDRMPKSTFHTPSSSEGDRPGDAFNNDPQAQEHIRRLLLQHGWNQIYGKGDALYLRRPGKERGISATLGYIAPGVFYCFSTSTIFEAEKGYSPFQVYAFLEHKGDFAAAAKALREGGYGSTKHGDTKRSAEEEEEWANSTWNPESPERALKGEGPPPATILHRSDGVGLFYPARINVLAGEPESGKSWIALYACFEGLSSGRHVAYVDFEDTIDRMVERLREFGVPDDVIRNDLSYIRPSESFKNGGAQILKKIIKEKQPSVVILDGVSEALAFEGFDPSSNKDIPQWFSMVPRSIANLGPSVILIDHVTKDKESRGRWPLGAQAKLAGIDGVSYSVEVVQPLAPGHTGELRMKVTKDRGGYVSQYQVGRNRLIGKVIVDEDDGDFRIRILPPDESGKFEPTVYMERISRLLATYPDGLTQKAIREAVEGANKWIDLAIKSLHAGGYIEIERQGGRVGHVHKFVRIYEPGEQPNADDVDREQE